MQLQKNIELVTVPVFPMQLFLFSLRTQWFMYVFLFSISGMTNITCRAFKAKMMLSNSSETKYLSCQLGYNFHLNSKQC